MKGITGKLETGVFLQFEVFLPEIKMIDRSKRFPIVSGSKTNQKGAGLPFDTDQKEAIINYKTLVDDIVINVSEVKTMPLSKIYVKLPNSENLAVSEFYLEGYLQITKVNIAPKQKTITGEAIQTKLLENGKLSIDSKIFIETIGPPFIIEHEHETEYGAIKRIRNSLDAEI